MEWVEMIGMEREEIMADFVTNRSVIEDLSLYTSKMPRR